MFSCARIGLPAATWPTTGTPPPPFSRMPRDVPGTRSSTPFFASTLRCCSAAFGELKPKRCAISTRVGGRPVVSIHSRMRFRISSWRGVSSCMSMSPYTVYLYSIKDIGSMAPERRQCGRRACGQSEATNLQLLFFGCALICKWHSFFRGGAMSRTSELLKLPGVVAAALFSRKGYLEEFEGALSETEATEMGNLCADVTMNVELQGRLLARLADQHGWDCHG